MKKLLFLIYGSFLCFIFWYGFVASKTFDGAVSHSFEKGMDYPRKVARLKELGWQFKGMPRWVPRGSEVEVGLEITGPGGKPVTGASVSLDISRPASAEAIETGRVEETRPGHYVSSVVFPGHGLWLVTATIVSHDDEFTYEYKIYADDKGQTNGT